MQIWFWQEETVSVELVGDRPGNKRKTVEGRVLQSPIEDFKPSNVCMVRLYKRSWS
jgi:hypothetical protein